MRSLLALADAYRTTTLPNGKVVHGTGSAVIFADILGAVARDVPRSLLLSFAFTLAVVVVTFRKRTSELWAVLFAFATAVAGVMIYLAVASVKINFLNFAALPVTFGIGVDYAVNVAQRRAADGDHDMSRVLRTTGGAVVLCSLTTFLGYVALVGSHNRAIRSLGTIAAVGEVCCLLAAVIIVPAWFSFSAVDITASRASAAGSPRSRA